MCISSVIYYRYSIVSDLLLVTIANVFRSMFEKEECKVWEEGAHYHDNINDDIMFESKINDTMCNKCV